MRKTVTLLIGAASVAALLAITACKQFLADIEEDFSYWAAEPVITGFKIDPSVKTQQNNNRVLCVPSAGPVTVTLTVHNPKNFSFIMPNSPGAPADIVSFGDDKVKGSGGAKPFYGTDYTLEPTSDGKALKLTYTAAFLKANERSSANIGAAITLYSTDGRKFNQNYKFDLEANTPPPDPAPVTASTAGKIALFKTRTADSQGKYYYVLCFKANGLPGENMPAGVPLHSDLTHVYVSKNGGTEKPYPVTLNSSGFNISQSGGNFIAKTDTASLSNAEAGVFSGSPQPDSVPSGSWVLYLKTDVPVGEAAAKYGIRLFDGKLYSARAEQTIGKSTLPAPKVFAHADMDTTAVSGVYTEKGATDASGNEDLNATNSAAHSGSKTDPIPVYSAYGEAVKLTIKQNDGNDYPTGVILSQGVQLVSGSGLNGSIDVRPDFIKLPSPADGGGEAVYKVTVKATGEAFDDSTTRTLYYKVCREVKTVTSTLPMWHILKEAIAHTSAGGTVVVNGEIKATNASGNFGEIEINKNLTIRGETGAGSDILDANSGNLGSNARRIFSVTSGTLKLNGLTLKGGKAPMGANGGGVYVSNSGRAELSDCVIENCTADVGGGIGASGNVKLTNTSIKTCEAASTSKCGGAVYAKGCTFELEGCTLTGNKANDGGAIYVYGAIVNITNCTLTRNTAEKNGGAVYAAKDGTVFSTVIIKGGTIGGTGTDANTVTDMYGFGGGIYINDDCTLKLDKYMGNGVRIIGNKAGRAGGVRANNSTVIMTDCTFSGNSATDSTPLGGGGGVYTHKGTLSMTNCTLTHNTAIKGGGVILEGTNTTMSNCTLTRNEAENGGAIYVKEIDGTVSTVTIKGGTVGGTGADDANKATGTGSNGNGGGIYIGDSCTLTLENNGSTACTLTGNEAAKAGGGVYVDGTMTMSGSATVTPSVGSDIDKQGKNDVYLKSGKTITVNGKLNPTGGTAARITPETYSETPQVQVLTGAIQAYNNYTKFTVTQASGRNWSVNDKGCLKKQ